MMFNNHSSVSLFNITTLTVQTRTYAALRTSKNHRATSNTWISCLAHRRLVNQNEALVHLLLQRLLNLMEL
ncbi:hypothetical protein YC2023_021729 [Brassica napus]